MCVIPCLSSCKPLIPGRPVWLDEVEVWSATSISVWQHVKLSEQIRPCDTLACWSLSNAGHAVCGWLHRAVWWWSCSLLMTVSYSLSIGGHAVCWWLHRAVWWWTCSLLVTVSCSLMVVMQSVGDCIVQSDGGHAVCWWLYRAVCLLVVMQSVSWWLYRAVCLMVIVQSVGDCIVQSDGGHAVCIGYRVGAATGFSPKYLK